MNMPFSGTAIVVSEEERQELQQMAQSRSLAAGDVMRARMMLLLSEGVPYRKIQEVLDTTAPTISMEGAISGSWYGRASRFGVSKDTVQRILTQADVRPH